MILRPVALSLLLALPGAALGQPITPAATDAPPGVYAVDAAHTRVMFSVSHMGFSDYTAFFTGFEATLGFDPADPQAMTLTATVDAGSVETLYPDPAFDFNAVIEGPDFLDAAAHPRISFTATDIRLTGPDTALVTGDFTLRGVTRPLTLDVRFNGGYPGMELDPGGRVGFSATGSLNRSDFGMTMGIPPEGSNMGVFDEVTIRIETEMVRADAPPAP